jgi:hypothetical protein
MATSIKPNKQGNTRKPVLISKLEGFNDDVNKHYLIKFIHLNKVLQKFSTARPSSSVAKHKLLRDTKKQQDVKDHNTIYRQTRESLFIKM